MMPAQRYEDRYTPIRASYIIATIKSRNPIPLGTLITVQAFNGWVLPGKVVKCQLLGKSLYFSTIEICPEDWQVA